MYRQRRPNIITIMPLSSVERFLAYGVGGTMPLSDRVRRRCQQVAAAEIENIAGMMDAEPMGLQFGLLPTTEPSSVFSILRARDRATLSINPFRTDTLPSAPTGIAMITGADEAVASHQRVAEGLWREAIKGPAAAARLRGFLTEKIAA